MLPAMVRSRARRRVAGLDPVPARGRVAGLDPVSGAWVCGHRLWAAVVAALAPSQRPRTALAVAAACLVVVVLGPRAAVIVLPGGLGCLVWWWRRAQARLVAARRRQLPEALERMAGALRTGSSVSQALAEAARTVEPPLGPELGQVSAATMRGRPLAEVVDEWAAGRGEDDTRLVATALVLAATVGAAPARALDGVAATLRERLDLAAERRTLATQARASALVLSAAPVGFALLLGLSDPAVADFMLGSTTGGACVVAGVGLDALGALWMARMTRDGGR